MDYEIGKCNDCVIRLNCSEHCLKDPDAEYLLEYITGNEECIDCGGLEFTYCIIRHKVNPSWLSFVCSGCNSCYLIDFNESLSCVHRLKEKGRPYVLKYLEEAKWSKCFLSELVMYMRGYDRIIIED